MEAMAAWTEAAQVDAEDSRVGGSSLAYRYSSARGIVLIRIIFSLFSTNLTLLIR